MSGLIDPRTGRSIGAKQEAQEMAKMLHAVNVAFEKINALSQQQVHLGLFVEYMVDKLAEKEIDIDMTEFPKFAEARWEEIQKEAQAHMDKVKAEANSPIEAAEKMGVDFTDD